jgi:hypothetical protein
MRGRGARILLLLAAAFLFGIVASVVKGNGAGVRDGVGNLSAPWIIVPLLASAAGSRARVPAGAVIGSLATAVALAGFYLANAFVLDLGSHSTLHDIGLAFSGGNLWFRAGVMSGPAMGAVGAWAIRRGRLTVAGIAVACVLFEPLAVYVAYLGSNGFFAAGNGEWNGVYAAEAGVGAIASIALWRGRVTRRRARQPPT